MFSSLPHPRGLGCDAVKGAQFGCLLATHANGCQTLGDRRSHSAELHGLRRHVELNQFTKAVDTPVKPPASAKHSKARRICLNQGRGF